jgi:hypothetical protein
MLNFSKLIVAKVKFHYQYVIDRKHSSLFLSSCLLLLLLASCQKSVFFDIDIDIKEPKDSSAVFSLVVSDSACSAALLYGSFLEQEPLTGNENISIDVFVSKTGKWSLSTDTLNGVSFAGSGTFADVGKQVVILKALGTPATVGNYYFSVIKGSLIKIFPVSVLKSEVQTEPVPLESYFKGTIGGVPYYVESPRIGPDNIPYGPGGGDTASFVSFVGPDEYPSPPGKGTISLQKGFLYGYAASTEADFKAFFAPGAYPFSPNKCRYFIFPGIILTWVGSDQEAWSTLKELGDQRGSSFTIVGIEDGHDNEGKYFVKVKSRFNCKLYNYRTGEMKELTDGELVSYFKR